MKALRLPKAENGASQSCCNIALKLIEPPVKTCNGFLSSIKGYNSELCISSGRNYRTF
jgi:hypothetical protein